MISYMNIKQPKEVKSLVSQAANLPKLALNSQQPDLSTLASGDTYVSQRASGSPLVVGAHGAESLFPTLGARVHHPLLPQAGLQSLTLDK